jgi:DnaK suppressor protein
MNSHVTAYGHLPLQGIQTAAREVKAKFGGFRFAAVYVASSAAVRLRSSDDGRIVDRLLQWTKYARLGQGMNMKKADTKLREIQEILERKEAELVQILKKRDGIAIEKSADQMDEVQFASERDLAIRNADRESELLREVRAALQRIDGGWFGACVECESAISPKRLVALPWASRCIHCQELADRNGQEGTNLTETLVIAA